VSVDHVFYVAPDNTLAGLREGLKRTLSKSVILVVPGVSPLRKPAQMQLLRRYGDQMNVTVIVVTRDRETEHAARRHGLRVYSALKRVPAKLRGDLTREEMAGVPALPGVPIYRWFGRLVLAATAAVLLVGGVAALALAAALLLPQATIRLTPALQDVTTTLDVTASTQVRVIDVSRGQLPARAVQVIIEDTGSLATTAVKRMPDAAAKGTVVFVNRGSSPVTIPVSTTVRTATGATIRFQTEEEAQVQGGAAASVRVPIKAIEPGPLGNVSAGAISLVEGPLWFQVGVLNDQDTRGGSEKETRIVTQQDRNTLRDSILEKIRTQSLSELRKTIQPGDILLAETLTLAANDVSFDNLPDVATPYLTGRVRATASSLVLDSDSLAVLVSASVGDQVPPGFAILPGAISYGAPSNVRYSEGIVSLRLALTAHSQSRIDKQDVQRLAAGKSPAMAAQVIAQHYALARPPQITLEHSQFGSMPLFTSRITVIAEGQ
jgi:hypothetical protein